MSQDFNLQDRFCSKPFEFALLGPSSTNVVMSCCWLNKSLGHISAEKSLLDYWNSKESQEIRNSILDGSFRYCKTNVCPYIQSKSLPHRDQVSDPIHIEIIKNNKLTCDYGPSVVQLNNDSSCNLSCPQCRTQKELLVAGPEFDARKKIFDKTVTHKLLSETKYLNITGAGDPFASKLYRDFLTNLDGSIYPNLKINLFTNGVLFDEKIWNKIKKIHQNIYDVRVSIDAATESVYNVVRRGGDFNKLLENIKFLSGLKNKGYFRILALCFVVQERNYTEMADLVRFAKSFGNITVSFQKIYNWGTFTDSEFAEHDICNESHPKHNDFVERLTDNIFNEHIVDMGNLTPYKSNKNLLAKV